jgi:transposase
MAAVLKSSPMPDPSGSPSPAAASAGARRATAEAAAAAPHPDPEVTPIARRRQFSGAQKQRILQEADRCTQPGEIGALLRREGIYASMLSTWRKQREKAEQEALQPRRRGPKPDPLRAEVRQILQLQEENARLRADLERAHLVIDVQKKLSAILGLPTPPGGQP